MSSMRQLLHDAAPVATRPFDPVALVLRARRRRRRRLVVWIAGIVTALSAVAIPNPLGTVLTGTSSQRVDTVGPPGTTTPASSVPADRSGDAATAVASPPPSTGTSIGSDNSTPLVATSGDEGAPAARSPEWFSSGPGRTYEGCRVYARASDDATGPVTPNDDDGVRECTYIATVAGGYEGAGTWTLEIVRDGETITFDSLRDPTCQPVGVVQPGDVVHAYLGLRTNPAYASAGAGQWHLSVGTWVAC